MLHLAAAAYTYPSGVRVGPVDLEVRAGEVVVLTGPTGCGKSTVARLATGLVHRHGQGTLEGTVRVDGRDPAATRPSERVALAGFVAQDPGDQLVTGTLGDEVAFGLESAGWDAARIHTAVERALADAGLPPEPERATGALSAGQRQRLVVAAATAGGARLLVLDEPLSQLDPRGARLLVEHLQALARGGLAVLVVEHRLERALAGADRVLVMDEGRVVSDRPAHRPDLALLRRLGLEVPGLMDLADRVGDPEAATLRPASPPAPAPPGPVVLEARGLRWSWDGSHQALDGVDLEIRAGERVALLGANGSGKSTLLSALAGHLDAGAVHRGGRLVDVPQEPDLSLFCSTVGRELAYGPGELGLPATLVREVAGALELEALLPRPPQALSRGQRQRVAVGAALTAAPAVLLLDEPTSGQDRSRVEATMEAAHRALGEAALVFATHDVGLALRRATRAVVLHAGRVVAEGPPAEVLAHLPPEVPVELPPLAAWCLERGLPPLTAPELAGEAR